jgi:hypothetical protein
MARMMREDVSSLNMLRNNAKIIGGVLGAEHEFFEKRDYQGEYYLEKNQLEF